MWEASGRRGIVSVVTGGGKTVFALSCIERARPNSTLVVVPTTALLEQWWEESANYFGIGFDEVNIVSRSQKLKQGTINIAVLNTAAKLLRASIGENALVIVDECHKAASEKFKSVLAIPFAASLGLSATPERPYDEGLEQVLIPALGPVIYRYDYSNALRDGVIVPFCLSNLVFDLEPDRQAEYERLTKAIARSLHANGAESEKTIALLLKRSRVLNLSLNRIRLAIRLSHENRGKKTLIFHEDIEACDLINVILKDAGFKCGVYHSKLPMKIRAQMLGGFRRGDLDVLVTCRALDEGFNVPETEIGIIAASTATLRQRIQRLGRIVRPARDKTSAVIFTLVATSPEIQRLKDEEERLSGVAKVTWSAA